MPLDKTQQAMWLATAILSTIAVALSGAYATLNPTTLKTIALVLFTVACTLNWVEYTKRRASK